MGNSNATVDPSSPDDLSRLLWTLNSDVVQRPGQIKVEDHLSVRIGNKLVFVRCASNVFWVGILLKESNWIHTGVGLHNDIYVEFDDGNIKKYQYLVADATARERDKKLQIHLTFANNHEDIFTGLANAFGTEVDYESFPPVIAGDTGWRTPRLAEELVRKMEHFLECTIQADRPPAGPGETNCVHFSAAMYLFLAQKEEKMTEILGRVSRDASCEDKRPLLRKLAEELNKISPTK